MRLITIWDGLEFRQEPEDVANKLIAENKAQDAAKEDGFSLKFRKDFKGYLTREIRAESPTPVIPASGKATSQETEKPEKAGAGDAVNWNDYKDECKEATGAQRVSQSKVEEWMRSEGII